MTDIPSPQPALEHDTEDEQRWPNAVTPAPDPAPDNGSVTRTAPVRIWLNLFDTPVNTDGERLFPDDHEGVTWAEDEVGDYDVQYVRADLAAIPAPEGGESDRFEAWLNRFIDQFGRTPTGSEVWQARAALAAPAPQAPAWQPIETAPKDGSRLILWWAGMTRVGRCAGVGAARDGGDWWQCPSLECAPTGRPTHWMPLPAAPQTKEPKA